jgi:acetoin utilization deacetylase AcuC-like enzyme
LPAEAIGNGGRLANVFWQRQRNRWSWWTERGAIPVWYAAEYRLSVPALNIETGFDLRRAERAVSFLLETRVLHRSNLRHPAKADLGDLLRVHDETYLQSLLLPDTLARILALHPNEVPVEVVLDTLRRATGATIEAARESRLRQGPTLNLLGGFHHAARASGGGLSAINDVAVAVAVLRHEGMCGMAAVIDLDAHPPDGIAECLSGDERTWIGSISATSFGPLPRVDEIVLPSKTKDDLYLLALADLLRRCPRAEVTFVLAGGDCLVGDRLGGFALTLPGLRRRDEMVERHLRGHPSVWLPAGGYSRDAWRVLAQTGLVLAGRPNQSIPPDDTWLAKRMTRIACSLPEEQLGEQDGFDDGDWFEDLMPSASMPKRLLGYYTPSGLEYALHRYGVLEELRRLGYSSFHVAFERVAFGERVRLFGHVGKQRHLLVEAIMERTTVGNDKVLYVHWLELRHPIAESVRRPFLPGQHVAGLGMLREAGELFALVARRLGLQGFAFAPAHYHMAYIARNRLGFVDEERQGRFEAMVRDFEALELPLDTLSRAVQEGQCTLNGAPYAWEPATMVCWLDGRRGDTTRIARAREHAVFAIVGRQ